MRAQITSLVLLSLFIGSFSAPISGQIKAINDGPLASYFSRYPGPEYKFHFFMIFFGVVLKMLHPWQSEHMVNFALSLACMK